MQAPCKDCENRFVGCHSQCEKYQEYNKQQIRVRQERLDKAEQDQYVKQIIDRIMRKQRQREGKL